MRLKWLRTTYSHSRCQYKRLFIERFRLILPLSDSEARFPARTYDKSCGINTKTVSFIGEGGIVDIKADINPPGHNPLDQNPLSVARPDETPRT